MARCGLGLILALGCAQIFGIDEACVLDEACGVDRICSAYCERIQFKCEETPQYDFGKAECESLCPFFPRATDSETVGTNTFECRLARATSLTREASDCFAAGRGGQDGCGSNCEAYCSLMQGVCPDNFANFDSSSASADADTAACRAECDRLVDTKVYDPSIDGEFEPPGQSTVQCRLWHLGAAAIEIGQPGADTHCGHAAGAFPCSPTPPAP